MKKQMMLSLTAIITIFMIRCSESFLDQQSVGILGDELLVNAEGVHGLLTGAYAPLNGTGLDCGPDQPVYVVIRGAECYRGSDAGDADPAGIQRASRFACLPVHYSVRNNWTHYYDAVDRCNKVLRILTQVHDLSDNANKQIEAEVRFLRAHYYFYLKRNFKNIPWIDETTEDVRIPNMDKNGNYVNIWPQIAADMDFARQNLPEIQADLGRPNRWAAECYYAKILIYRACEGEYPDGFNEALVIFTDVIENGITMSGACYDLEANYHDNFDASTENGPECVWAVQMSVNDGTPPIGLYAAPNGDPKYGWISASATSGPGLGRGWGFYQPTPWYADHFRTDANGLPYLDMYNTNPNRLKDDYGLEPAPLPPEPDPFEPDTMGVDPRLDWTISRRAIPCLDYGSFPGSSWIRNQLHGGRYITKKWYPWKYQVGIYTSANNRNSAMNIQVIRFADVLLMAAECEARVGSLDKSRDLVNRVRQRMINNTESSRNRVKREDGVTDAANYHIAIYPKDGAKDPFQSRTTALDAILFEHTLELGTEGHRFYDVVRFGKGEEIFNEFIQVEKERFDYLYNAIYTDFPDAYLPIPEEAIERSKINNIPTLTQNPGY